MSKTTKYKTKPASELLPGEYVLLGWYWLKVESIEPGPMSRYQPDKQLAVIRGWRQRWLQSEQQGWARGGEYVEAVMNDNGYMDSVYQYLPAD